MIESHELTHALHTVAHAINDALQEQKVEFSWMVQHHHFATKQDLETLTHKIMSVISDFAAKQSAFNDRQDAAITDLQGDIQSLNDLITQLQSTQGQITPEDQALLDQLQTRAQTAAEKLEALDALTPPKAPTTPETPPTDPTARRNA